MASISSSNHRLSRSKRRLKPSILRDYLLDDLSSCSSNGFKSFPRRQSPTVHRLHSVEIKRSEMLNQNRRLTCGLPVSHAVHRASTVLLNAVKLLPFPSSSTVKSPSPSSIKKNKKRGIFSRSFWKKPSRREPNVDGKKVEEDGEATLSPSFSSELYMNSETAQSQNDDVEKVRETVNGGVMESGPRVSDNREECENEETEQLSPISILECPFEDDLITPPPHQNERNGKKLMRRSRRFKSLERLAPVDLEKRIEQHNTDLLETDQEDISENRANRLFALVKSRLIEEPNYLLASHNIDSVVLDFFKEEGNNIETRDEDKLVKIVEEWVMRRQEEKDMFMSWEVREKREIYVREMKWGCVNGDGTRFVVEDLENSFVTSLIDELILDISL